MAEGFDYKKLGLTALDVVVGVGSAVAGGYGGPEAAKGVQMAGSAIKSGVNNLTGDESRAEKYDRADFQARGNALELRNSPPPTEQPSDDGFAREELLRKGWSAEQAESILAGPGEGTTLASLLGERNESSTRETGGRRNRGRVVGGAEGRRVPTEEGQIAQGNRGKTAESSEGSSSLAAIGKVLTGVLSNKG